MDRDDKFCTAFKPILENEGVNPVPLPLKSPNLNAHLERFFGALKSECLERMIFFGENMVRAAIRKFLERYHAERNHQGLDNQIIEPGDEIGRSVGDLQCRERLGGLLRYYYREAAYPAPPHQRSGSIQPNPCTWSPCTACFPATWPQ